MAGVGFVAATAEITSGTAAITLLQIVAPTNQRLKVREVSVSGKGVSNTGTPGKVRVLRQTSAGTMSALTPVKWDSTDDETLQVTAQHTATAEPSAGNVLMIEEMHPQTGFCWQAPFGGEIIVPGGTRLGVEITLDASISVVARMIGEE